MKRKPSKPRPEPWAQTGRTDPGGGAADPGGSAFGAGSEKQAGATAEGTSGQSRAVDKPPNFVNVTRYHDKNPAKIAEIFQRKRSWFPMPWPLSSF